MAHEQQKLDTHVFNFNPQDNGGECFSLTTEFWDNGDGEIFTNQEVSLQSYFNSASFQLSGLITPENLRALANTLESKMAVLKAKMEVKYSSKKN